MSSIACTLFENHYHHGVAALANSLYRFGYRGTFYVGYRGKLEHWCANAKPNPHSPWPGSSTLEVANGLTIQFLPVSSAFHLTFYKPYFMLDLFKVFGSDVDGVIYFDPDIVVKCKWPAFEGWLTHGVALVHESINRPVTHPLRGEWKKVIHKMNRQVTREVHSYINGGFIGVAKQDIEFLRVWTDVIEIAIRDYNLTPTRLGQTRDRTYLFYNADQDALNVAAMCSEAPISEIGPEGMDLLPGGFIMSHALGRPKPWNKKFIRAALKAKGPTMGEKGFWLNVQEPIPLYSETYVRIKFLKISIASLIQRFYKRA